MGLVIKAENDWVSTRSGVIIIMFIFALRQSVQ